MTTLVHGAEQVARAEHASSLLFGEDITTLAGRRCAGGVRGCAVDRAAGERVRGRRHRAGRSGCARAARAVEERSAAAGAVGRRLREQPAGRRIRRRGSRASRRSAGGCSCCGRARSRTHLVRLDLTLAGAYAILPVTFEVEASCRAAEDSLRRISLSPEVPSGSSDGLPDAERVQPTACKRCSLDRASAMR